MTVSPTATRFPSSTSACGRARVSSLRRTAPPTRSRPPAAKTRPTPAVHTGAWSGTPIRDTGCCCHPLTGVPCLRPGPRGTEEMMQPCPPNLKCHLFGGTLEQLLHRQPDAAVRVRALLLHLHLQDRPGPVGRLPRRHPRDAVGKHRPGAPGRNRHAPAGRGLHRLRHQHRLGATLPLGRPLFHCLCTALSLSFHCLSTAPRSMPTTSSSDSSSRRARASAARRCRLSSASSASTSRCVFTIRVE